MIIIDHFMNLAKQKYALCHPRVLSRPDSTIYTTYRQRAVSSARHMWDFPLKQTHKHTHSHRFLQSSLQGFWLVYNMSLIWPFAAFLTHRAKRGSLQSADVENMVHQTALVGPFTFILSSESVPTPCTSRAFFLFAHNRVVPSFGQSGSAGNCIALPDFWPVDGGICTWK